MILNLTGNHIVTPGAVYPATIPAPTVRLLDTPPDYPTPAEILADLGVPLDALAALDPATLGGRSGPIRVAPILDGIEGFPDIPPGVGAVIVQSRIAEAMRYLGLTVRRGVAVLTPALQRCIDTREAIRYVPDHAATIRSLTGVLTWADALTLYDDLTGLHDAPGLHRDTEHPADTAILRLMDETGAVRAAYDVWSGRGAPRAVMLNMMQGDVVVGKGATWTACAEAAVAELRARGMLPPERLDGGGR